MTQSEEPMKACPSYERCRAPVCPLESVYPSKTRFRFPKEAKCSAHQTTRYRFGKGLKFHGLFAKEYLGYARADGFKKLEDSAYHTTVETQNQGV